MSEPLLIYGATGYTGRLVAEGALKLGIRPLLAGRNEAKLAAMAQRLGLDYRVVHLGEPQQLDRALRDIRVVLHAAGPFSQTAMPMVEACLRRGVHYLDITAEIRVIEDLARRDADARQRQVMIMPAVGFDVVPSDCLAAHVHRRLRTARRLIIALSGFRSMTRGTAKTLVEGADFGVVRRDGALSLVPLGTLQRWIDYGDGPRLSLNISWGDVATAYYTTGIPNVETYYEITPMLRTAFFANRYLGWLLRTDLAQVWLKAHVDVLPEGPSDTERDSLEMAIVAEAEDAEGRRVMARLRTPEAYSFTGVTAPAIIQRVLQDDFEPGFQTPARVYGADFVLSFPGVSREDVE